MKAKELQRQRRAWLATLVRNSGITQRAFAGKVGINCTALSNLLNSRPITDRTVVRVANALGVPPPDGGPLPGQPTMDDYERLRERVVQQEYRLLKLSEEMGRLSLAIRSLDYSSSEYR